MHDHIKLESELEMGKRLQIGGVAHLALFAVLFLATPFMKDHRALTLAAGFSLIAIGFIRFWLSHKQQEFYPQRRVQWVAFFDLVLIFTACLWGLLCVASIHFYGLASSTTSILFLVVSGVCAGAATSLNPSAKRASRVLKIPLV